MAAVTITGADIALGDKSATTTTVNKSDNIATLKTTKKPQITKGLKAIDTYGNVFEVPDYSIGDILGVIPKHCYKRSALLGMGYVARDIALLLGTGYLAHTYIPLVESTPLRAVSWSVYVVLQSFYATGLWVLAHECGHNAFSEHAWIDHLVGWVLHSYLLVPFFSWKYSHRKHHKGTGHMTKDMVFVPQTKEEFLAYNNVSKLAELSEDSPIVSLYQLLRQQLGGWVVYLLCNVTGQPYEGWDNKWAVNHFNPNSPIFDKQDYNYILLSDLGIIAQGAVLYFWYQLAGGWSVTIDWFFPYLLVNHWLVFITFLQHSDPVLPHYDASEWTFARGAACTIDRQFWFVGPWLFHDIIETHVLHHYCSRIPFYHAREATDAIRKVMGKHYKYSDENMWKALWKATRMCQFVDGENGVKMFRNINHEGVAPVDVDGKALN